MTTARELTARLADLLQREHHAMADFLVALADFDRRRVWLALGHSSLFYFLHRELGLSKGAAHYRKTAAELVQKFPEVVEPLREGKLCITSVVELAKVITPENRAHVLPRFFHRSKQEAKAVSAELQPAAAVPRREIVTAVRVVSAVAVHVPAPAVTVTHVPSLEPSSTVPVQPDEPLLDRPQAVQPDEPRPPRVSADVAPVRPAAQRDSVEPLTADLFRMHVTVSRRLLDKLEAARAALSHARPGATAEEILEAGLDLVLAQHAKRKGLVAKPRKEPMPAKPDHVPAHVKRAVWTRDGGRCQWPVDAGGICGSTLRLQFDHVVPRARGGPSTVENLRLACAVHNQLAARLAFGDGWMDQFTRKKERPREQADFPTAP